MSQADHGVKTWQVLAQHEAAQGNWYDAVEDLSQSLGLLPLAARKERADILALRGRYSLLNHAYNAAREDWAQALSLAPKEPAIIRSLARLHLLGPPEHRDPHTALGLIAGSAADPNPNPEDLMILGIAQVRLGRYEQGLSTLEKVADSPTTRPHTARAIVGSEVRSTGPTF